MKTTSVQILTIGNELLFGFIKDTNLRWMSEELSQQGFTVVRHVTVGDDKEHILEALSASQQWADVVLITGGLGPTSDDMTKSCLAAFFNCGMRLNKDALADVERFIHCRGRSLTEADRQQAVLPSCCEKIANPIGTACGMWFEPNGKVFVAMPGVSAEMKKMMDERVIPKLKARFKTDTLHHWFIRTVGIGESSLAHKIASWEHALPVHTKLAYLPKSGEVRLRLTRRGGDPGEVKSEFLSLTNRLQQLVGDYIYGCGEDELESVVGRMLHDQNRTLAVAESCTGGYLSHRITSVPGSSRYYLGGIVAYSNEVKIKQLGVHPETLAQHGAVSRCTVEEMAKGVRNLLGARIGIATSGVAGPGGATSHTPLGNVWIALSDHEQTYARSFQWSSARFSNIHLSSLAALNMLRKHLLTSCLTEKLTQP